MRGDEIADGKDVVDETRAWTLLCQTMSSLQINPRAALTAGLTLPSQFQSAAVGLGPDGDETCFPYDRERASQGW
jgi:hypothetical protein